MPLRLTPSMKKALIDEIRGYPTSVGRGTVKALQGRRLMDNDGSLTAEGLRQAVAGLPLEEQCKQLDLELQHIAIPNPDDQPEVEAWRHFRSEGFIGSCCEGGAILVLIRASALGILTALNTFKSRDDACVRFTEAQLTILAEHSDQILEAIRDSNTEDTLHNFEEIYSHDLVREWYPSLSSDGIAALHSALGPGLLAEIAMAIMENPYTYRKGWPDLTMVRDGSILWAEVKTTDRLLLSQITTLQRMRGLLPGFVGVVRLAKTREVWGKDTLNTTMDLPRFTRRLPPGR